MPGIPQVTLPATIKCEPGAVAEIVANTDCPEVQWIIPPGLAQTRIPGYSSSHIVLTPHKEGEYQIIAYVARDGIPSVPAYCTLSVQAMSAPAPWLAFLQKLWPIVLAIFALIGGGTVAGTMAGSAFSGCKLPFPIPVPTPTPPAPAPGPLKVMMLYEEEQLNSYSEKVKDALFGADVKAYCQAHCAKGTDGKSIELRVWDKKQNPANDEPYWKEAMAQAKSFPWLIVGNGKTGYSGPFPDDVLGMLKKFGGA